MPPLLTMKEYAALRGATYSTVKRWAHEGMPVRRQPPSIVLIEPVEADAWVAHLRPIRIRFHRTSVVYFAKRSDGAIKIGFTSDVAQRLKDLHKRHGAVVLLASVEGDKKTEAAIQHGFASCALGEEWFRPEPHLLAFIAGLKGKAA